jgi:HrpA-like RNA helicase
MANFPLTPKMTKILLLAARNGCGATAMTLLA